MTRLPAGKALRLPLLGNVIVGAVMLLRSDAAQGPHEAPPPEAAPDMSRFSVVLDLPEPTFGRDAAPRVAVAKDAQIAFPAANLVTVQARGVLSLSTPVVAMSSKSEPPGGLIAVAAPPSAAAMLAASPSASPSPPSSPATSAALGETPFARSFPALPANPAIVPAGPAAPVQADAALADEARLAAPGPAAQPAPGAIPADPFPAPAFGSPIVVPQSLALEATGPANGLAAAPQRTASEASVPAALPGADASLKLAEAPEADAAPSADSQAGSLPQPRLALSLPVSSLKQSPSSDRAEEEASPAVPAVARAFPASEAPFPPGAEPTFSYDDELILQIETGRGEMADTIIAYGTRSGVYLPLGALTRFLDLAIAISDDGHYANGWFLSEDRKLTINLREGSIAASGTERSLERGEAIAFDGELYLRAENFAKLFPLKLTTDLRAQLVRIEPLEEFPYKQRIERDLARQRLESRKGKHQGDKWPRETTPWRAFSMPMTDIELRAGSDSSLGSRVEGDVRIAGDLAFMTARAYLSGSSRDGLTGARIELGRKDPDGTLLGPARATEFQLGDVDTQALPLGLRGIGGRGAAITNAPIDTASLFDAIDLRGELPEGYEVELYRNDVLVGSTRTPVNGQYEFLQVPVDFSQNVFRLVFFGPQGQRHEEVRRVSVGDGRRRAGELVYGFGIAQKDINLLGVRGPFDSRPPDYGAWRATGSLEYGITQGLTGQVAGSWFQTEKGSSWLASAGLRTGFGGTALRADIGLQKGGGKSAQFGIGGQLLGATYSLTHAEYSGRFIDEVRAFSSDFLDRASELNVNTTLSIGGDEPVFVPVSLRARRLEFSDGRTQSEAALRTSARFSGMMLSKTIEYASTRSPLGFSSDRLVGSFDLATLSGSRTQYRASVGYAVLPKLELRSAALQVDRAFGRDMLASASVGHTFDDGETRFGLSATRRFERFNLSFSGDYAVPTGAYSAMVRLGFGFGRNPLTGRFFVDQPGLATGGALAVRAYHDRNADNRFDDGDLVLPEVAFGVGGKLTRTDANGVAMIPQLGDGRRISYKVDMESLPDIALFPKSAGITFLPRAGRVHTSDFAVVALSEVEGTARFASAQGQKPVSGVQLELVGVDGAVIRSTRTEGDGFYLFEQVPPGDYTIRIEPGQAQRLAIAMAGEVAINANSEGEVVRKDLVIEAR